MFLDLKGRNVIWLRKLTMWRKISALITGVTFITPINTKKAPIMNERALKADDLGIFTDYVF
jgi:hypothetical protein